MSKEYEVGYGKPPTQTRFQPGQSGNPAGRKPVQKPETAIKPILQSILQEPLSIGNQKLMPLEIALKSLTNKAMKDDLPSIKMLFDLQEKHRIFEEKAPGGVLKITRVPPELRKLWAKMQQAKFRGEDPEGLIALEENMPESERGRY